MTTTDKPDTLERIEAEMRERSTDLHGKGYFMMAGDLRLWASRIAALRQEQEGWRPIGEPAACVWISDGTYGQGFSFSEEVWTLPAGRYSLIATPKEDAQP